MPLTALCALAVAALLVAERRGSRAGRYAAKPFASAAFIAVALAGGGIEGVFGAWVLAGLVLGAGGDVALMLPGSRAFLAGLVSFLAGHVAYVIAIAAVLAPAAWLSPWAAAPAAVAVAALVYLWPHLSVPRARKLRPAVLAYMVVITTMAAAALALVTTDAPVALAPHRASLLAAGALLFFASDLAVARQRFVSESFWNRAWGLPAYYAGQLLIAWSTFA